VGNVVRSTTRFGDHRRRGGFTIVELLIAASIFIVFLAAVTGVLTSSLRAHRVGEAQSLRIQETEAVVQLINYEVGLAGYTGTVSPQEFSNPTADTIRVTLGSGTSDRIRIRFFEDPDFLAPLDDGERNVEYRVDGDSLVRQVVGSTLVEELVGGVDALTVVAFIGRELQVVPVETVRADPTTLPGEIAGVRLTVDFNDGSSWTFLVGLYNRQRVSVIEGGA